MNDATDSAAFWIIGVPFIAAFVVAAGSWLLAVAEIAATQLLRDFLFELGPVATRRELELPLPQAIASEGRIPVGRCQLRFTGPTRAIFSARFIVPPELVPWRRLFGKGVVTWSGSRAEIVVRHLVGPLGFMLAWLAAWALLSLGIITAMLLSSACTAPPSAVPLLLLGGAVGFAMFWSTLVLGRRSASSMADELVTHIRELKSAR